MTKPPCPKQTPASLAAVTPDCFEATCRIGLFADRPRERVAVEGKMGKSDIETQSEKKDAGFDRVVLIATKTSSVFQCPKTIEDKKIPAEGLTCLEVS